MKTMSAGKCFYSLLVALVLFAGPALAQQQAAVNRPFSTEIADGVHVFSGVYAGVLAVTGPDGVLLVEPGPTWHAEDIQDLLAELGAGQVRIVIDTHFHDDHIGNNEMFANGGAMIIAHENARLRMQQEWVFPEKLQLRVRPVPAFPEVALPTMLVSDNLTVHFGGHRIEIHHIPGAHTDADLVVLLPEANVLHTGDLFVLSGIPPVDTYHGGSVDGVIAAVDKLVGMIDDDTRVVPGHGPVSNRREMLAYRQILRTGRDRIAALVAQGKSLEEVVAASPVVGLYTRGETRMPGVGFTRTVYAELAGWAPE